MTDKMLVVKAVELKTAELIGPALDWATAKAQGVEIDLPCSDVVWAKYSGAYSPSTDWSQGGPLIEEYRVEIVTSRLAWQAMVDGFGYWLTGETALIAACRAIVAAKLGEVVSVPAELVVGAQ